MKLGAFEIQPVTDGRFRLDVFSMLGVVPKVMWEKCCQPDDQNLISLGLNCLLIRTGQKNILVDTGLGDKEDAEFQAMFAVERIPTLRDSLKMQGLQPEDIHMIVNTHLHFDHAGGNTLRENGAIVPTFPRAKYFVQRGEYEDAARANERTRASYRRENFTPVAHVDQWEFMDGETELIPGVSVVVTEGHTRHHQSIKIESEGQIAFYLGDLIPTVSHLPLPYIMGYDLYPLQTLETKRWVLDRALNENWLLVFEHDPRVLMGWVRKDIEGKFYLEEVKP
jgi:glyoxylase-like metal-dependent hydrolase (beta-lactamase superfamily II)